MNENLASGPSMSTVAGIDLSSHAVDLILLDENSDQAVWHRYELTGPTAFDRCRQVRQQMPRASWWVDHGVYLAAVERPYGPSRVAQAALYRTLGAVIACVPFGVPLWEVSPQEWRAGIGLGGQASKTACAAAVAALTDTAGWPQDAHDAFAVAYTAREKNAAAIAKAAA